MVNLNEIIKQTALYQLLGRGNAAAYWDLIYLYRFGLPKVEGPHFPNPLDPVKAPIADEVALHRDILFSLVDGLAGDPTPQPNLVGLLADRAPRLQGARRALKRHEDAIVRIRSDIAALESPGKPMKSVAN